MATPFKIGILVGDAPDRPPAEIAPGYERAEIPVCLHVLPLEGDSKWKAHREEINAWGLPPIKSSSHWFNHPELMATGPDVDWDLNQFWTERAFARLAELGVEAVGCYGIHFFVPPGFSRTTAMDQGIRYANMMADSAAKYGMKVALEPMANLDTLFPRYLDGIAFVKEVGRPEIRVMADLAYFLALNQPFEDIAVEPDYCLDCHVAGEGGQPGIGDRVEIHKHLFRVLRDVGYEHAVTCACPWVSSNGGPLDFAKETTKTLKYLQDLRAEIYAE